MAKMNLAAVAMAAAAVAAGCCDKNCCGVESETVAAVGETKLTKADLDGATAKVLEANGGAPEGREAEVKNHIERQIVQQVVFNESLAAEAAKRGYSATQEELDKRKAEISAQAAKSGKTLEDLLSMHPFGKDKALAEIAAGIAIDKMFKGEIYSKDKTDYMEQAKAIVKQNSGYTEEEAKTKIAELKKTLDATPAGEKAAKFAALAKEHSGCPSGRNGGDLGEFGHGQMVPEFDKAAFALAPGEISDPVKTQFGYHLVMTVSKDDAKQKVKASHILLKTVEPGGNPTVEEVVESLRAQANRAKTREFVNRVVADNVTFVAEDYKSLFPFLAASAGTAAGTKAETKAETGAGIAVKPEAAPVAKPDGK